MRRLRSNPLAPPPATAPRENFSLSGLTVLGLVANPKTHEPALVVTDGEYVSIRSLSESAPLRRLGRGYYEEQYNDPEELTGYPRSHTPDGVVIKGKGWGTALYTALALGAHQETNDLVKIKMRGSGDGISSWTDNRSNEADKWWASALDPGMTSGQGRLFNPNQAGMSDVILAREACGWAELALLP